MGEEKKTFLTTKTFRKKVSQRAVSRTQEKLLMAESYKVGTD